MQELRVELRDGGRQTRISRDGVVIDVRDGEEFAIDLSGVDLTAAGRLDLGRQMMRALDGPGRVVANEIAETGDDLVLLIDADVPSLRRLPWEVLADTDGHVALRDRMVLPVRVLSGGHAGPSAPANRPLRVLFMAASPEGGGPALAFEEEEARVLDAIGRDAILDVEESGTVEGLAEKLHQHEPFYFDVVHLTGHATIYGGEGLFQFEDEVGRPRLVSAAALIRAINGRWPRLMMVSGCRTGEAPNEGAFPSLAERLVSAGLPAALGWGRSVGDLSATEAAAEIYAELATGGRVARAAGRARATLLAAKSGYWWDLQVFARANGATELVTPVRAPGREKVPRRQAPRTAFLAGGKVEICPDDEFVGRRRVLQQGLSALLDLSPDAPSGIVLHGMGGYGKSSVAARLCTRLGASVAVVVGEVDETALLAALAPVVPITTSALLAEPNVPLARRLGDALVAYEADPANPPLVVVLDDFERSLESDEASLPILYQGRARIRADGAGVVAALAAAIVNRGLRTRVIVTTRYPFELQGPGRLLDIPLTAMPQSDVDKKLRSRLPAGSAAAGLSAEVLVRVQEVGAGNPRLLDRLFAAAETHSDRGDSAALEALLDRLDSVADEFREELCLRHLVDALSDPATRGATALRAVGIPIPDRFVSTLCGFEDAVSALNEAVAATVVDLALVEGEWVYSVSPLVEAVLPWPDADAERRDRERAADVAEARWGAGSEAEAIAPAELFEVWRTHLAVGRRRGATQAAQQLMLLWYGTARNAEAMGLGEETLASCDSWRVEHLLGRCRQLVGDSRARDAYERARRDAVSQSDVMNDDYAALLHNLAALEGQEGNTAQARRLYEESVAVEEQIGNPGGTAATLHQLAVLEAQEGNTAGARRLYEESLAIKEQVGDARGRSATLHQLAILEAQEGNTAGARRLYEESLAIKEQVGDARGRAATLHQLAGLEADAGNTASARELYAESLALKEQIGDARGRAATLHQMAILETAAGNGPGARRLCEEALLVEEQIGDARGRAATLHQMAILEAEEGNTAGARRLYEESLAIKEQIGDARGLSATLHQMAILEADEGNTTGARRLYEEALSIEEQIGNPGGRAATLHQMAILEAQDGNTAGARRLYEESLALKEQIGDARGRAVTLANLGVLDLQTAPELAVSRLREAARILGSMGALGDLRSVLCLLVQSGEDHDEGAASAAQLLLLMVAGVATTESVVIAHDCLTRAECLDEMTKCAVAKLVANSFDEASANAMFQATIDFLGLNTTAEAWVRRHGLSDPRDALRKFKESIAPLIEPGSWYLPRDEPD